IEKAISMANWELIPGYTKRTTCLDYTRAYFPTIPPGGIANHTWVQILLTDGKASHNTNCIVEEVQDAVNAGIRIYTIGLGPLANGNWLENYISNPTGGKYYFADKPEDLPAIYMEIANDVEDRSFRPLPGSEPEVLDAIPKILNPTGFSPAPTAVVDSGSYWLVKWEVNQILRIGDSWQATYEVSSDNIGTHDVTVLNTAKVQYTAWDNNRTEIPIPSAYLTVIDATPPEPPSNLMAELTGFYHRDVRISWTLSPDDGSLVHEYGIYRSNVFEQFGNGYVLYDSVPSGTAEYIDLGAGDGDLSDHFYYVCAFNITGIHSCNMNQVGKFTRPLSKGMNLISIPLILADDRLGTVLQTVRFNEVWNHDYTDMRWTWRMVYKPYLGEMQKIDHTSGYWVNVTGSCRLTVAGVVPPTTDIRLHSGWNLVSFPSFTTTYLVSDLKADTGATRIEGFDPSSSPYFLKEMTGGEALEAGYGYWVRVESETLWMVYNT
ncbi:MAG: VWA domain-containing protein, partial [Thermoplasmata archaeon]|nr:VWA domain-containing protein [Thermoplasmata archaeon]